MMFLLGTLSVPARRHAQPGRGTGTVLRTELIPNRWFASLGSFVSCEKGQAPFFERSQSLSAGSISLGSFVSCEKGQAPSFERSQSPQAPLRNRPSDDVPARNAKRSRSSACVAGEWDSWGFPDISDDTCRPPECAAATW